jgi:hypothetical protein
MASRFQRYLSTSAGDYRTDKDLQNILRNLNKEIVKIEGATQEGLIRATAKIHEETEKGSIKVPVDLGNLRHSWFYTTAAGRIIAGGSTPKMIGVPTGNFVGKNAGQLSAGHMAMKTEMTGKAKALSAAYKGPFVIAGYSANYALWVHEMLGAKFQRKGAGAKWFEIAIKTKQPEILKIIQSTAKIK